MTRTKTPGAEMDLAEREHPVILLHQAGYSFRKIAELTRISKSSCQRIYRAGLAAARGVKDIERHRAEVFADIELTLEILRPYVLGIPGPPDEPTPMTRDVFGEWWKAIKAKREFLGLDAPRESHSAVENVPGEVTETDVFLAELAAWARRTHAINVDGFHPALPPGMTERVEMNSNGHADFQPHGRSMWSMVVEFPSEDEE